MALTAIGLNYLEKRKNAFLTGIDRQTSKEELYKHLISTEYMRGYVGGKDRISADDADREIMRIMNGW
jgi:hypothetical protein